jgi:release factor glutamine methyltransferase
VNMALQNATWTVRDVLNWTSRKFSDLDLPSPLLDAQLLIGSVLALSKVEIYTQLDRPLIELERVQLRELVRRRMTGEPVAYLLKQKDWHDLDLYIDNRVLVPRPETETLLDVVLAVCKSDSVYPRRILDLCTGSGCLAVALAKKFPDAQVIAVDISSDALEVARINAERNSVKNIEFVLADAAQEKTYTALKNAGAFDLIVSNPPYVSEAEWSECDGSVRDFEPRLALVGGECGWHLPAQILEMLSKTELLSQAKLIGFELGVDHPGALADRLQSQLEICFSSPLQQFACQRPVCEFPRNQWFAVKDYRQKSRFLFSLVQPSLD